MSDTLDFDAIVMGGGLAGLSLALHLRKASPGCRVAVVDRSVFPLPEAAHKVGESTVELAAHYFDEGLGLGDHLRDAQLPKLGLRFFLPAGDNGAIDRRLEIGGRDFPPLPTFQIDRGRFENHLAQRCADAGLRWLDGCDVRRVTLGEGSDAHRVELVRGGDAHVWSARWVMDASGRRSLLKRQLDLTRPSDHRVGAAWFRIGRRLDVGEWSARPEWTRLHGGRTARWFSTNHLLGRGYWVWLIPLASGATSVGIVADTSIHPHASFSTFPKALAWLARHEPQCGEIVSGAAGALLDFRTLGQLGLECSRVYSHRRWCLTGDAGAFLDPFYSPGSDFISIANTFIADLVARDLRGEPVRERVEAYNATYLALHRNTLAVFLGQYPVFGAPRATAAKVLWDFATYWSFLCFVGIQGRLVDLATSVDLQTSLAGLLRVNALMQRLFVDWSAVDRAGPTGGHADVLSVPVVAEACRSMTAPVPAERFPSTLRARLATLEKIAGEIVARACAAHPDLTLPDRAALARRRSDQLGDYFDRVGLAPGPRASAMAVGG